MNHNKLWKTLKEMGLSDHLNCFLRNLFAAQEATVRTLHGTIDWFKIGKGVQQGCILSPYLTYMQSTSCKMLGWNQDGWEKYQPPQIWKKAKRNLVEGEGGE